MAKQTFSTIFLLISTLIIMATVPSSVAAQIPPISLQKMKSDQWREAILGTDSVPILSAQNGDASPVRSLAVDATNDLGDWSRLTFQSYRDGNWEIYLARGDGSQAVRLTNHPAADSRPRLNRGGTRVAFNSNRDGNTEIYTINWDGSGLSRLTNHAAPDLAPAWSPDSSRIAFASNRDGNYEIYVMQADGSGLVRLTYDGADDTYPVWSPDGSRIAWIRLGKNVGSLWVMQADGNSPRALTQPLTYLEHPIWSPDGTRLAFDYDRDGDLWTELATVNADGTDLRVVYDAAQDWMDAWMGGWSADGRWLILTRIEYLVYDQELYIKASYVEQVTDMGESWSQLAVSGYDMFPDAVTTDITPPVAHIRSLPAITRAAGFAVSWFAADAGGAGVAVYQVQVQDGKSGPWTTWLEETTETSTPYQGSPGHTYAFRVRARDNAYNWQPWQDAQPGPGTTLYSWQVTGTVQDIREVPIPAAPFTAAPPFIYPVVSNLSGSFQAFAQANGPQTLSATAPGYGTTPPMRLNLLLDTQTTQILPPADNLILDGNFETGSLNAWQGHGEPVPAITDTIAHTGNYAVSLGPDTPGPMVTEWASTGYYPIMAMDHNRTLHLVSYRREDNDYIIFYNSKSLTGTWPITPTVILVTHNMPVTPIVAPDGNGGVYLAWQQTTLLPDFSSVWDVYFCHKPATKNTCTPPQNMTPLEEGNAGAPKLALDQGGGLHIVWAESSGITYAYRSPAGIWSPSEQIPTGQTVVRPPQLYIDTHNIVHVVWAENAIYPWTGYYSHHTPEGRWSMPEVIGKFSQYGPLAFTGDPNGVLHLVWTDPGPSGQDRRPLYSSKLRNEPWTKSVRLEGLPEGFLSDYRLAADRAGSLHLGFYMGASNGNPKQPVYHFIKTSDGRWLPVEKGLFDWPWNAVTLSNMEMVVDNLGVMRFAWSVTPSLAESNIYHMQSPLAANDSDYELSHSFHIPSDMHQPTLSFWLSSPRIGSPENRVYTTVTHDLDTTTVISTTPTTGDWEHVWADMSPWAGQDVTITIGYRLSAGGPLVPLIIDEIALGSWLTPVITGITPSPITPGAPIDITITGQNFLATPQVFIDGHPVPDVYWKDERTLQAQLAGGLPPGTYEVRVINPGGQLGVAPGGLKIGQQIYLPLVY